MDWKLAWDGAGVFLKRAIPKGKVETAGRAASQMDESKPCHALSHAMSNGASLTSFVHVICKVFVPVPAVVAHQQYDHEQAGLRVRAQPSRGKSGEIHARLAMRLTESLMTQTVGCFKVRHTNR